MCGIAGIISTASFDGRLLKEMSALLRHRGPDDEGFALLDEHHKWQSFGGSDTAGELHHLPRLADQQPVTMGFVHRRLSIIDLSVHGHQPVISADGHQVMVFNGEIYNYVELRKEMQESGFTFHTDAEAEVVYRAIRCWGTKAFARFRGMWAIAFADTQINQLWLSRDRFGIKPLYYTELNGKLAFASEIKALIKTGLVPPEVSREKLFEYLTFGSLSKLYDEPFTHLKSVAPGSWTSVDLKTLRTRSERYYHLENAVEEAKQNRPDRHAFAACFEEAVGLHLRSDVPVGACLSGGLDSSAIVAACSQRMGAGPFPTFTAAFPGNAVDESHYAKMVAESFDNVQPHFITPTAEELVASLDEMIFAQDLPVGSTSVFAQWSVMKLAHSHGIKVLLDGQGADETLGGYYHFAGLRLIGLLRRGKFAAFVREYQQIKTRFTPAVNTALARTAYYYLPESLQRKLRTNQRLGARFIDPEYLKKWKMTVPARGGKDFESHAMRSIEYGLYELLRYEDRNSMAFGMESRVPFLDHKLVELVLALPESEKLHTGWTKFPVRHYLSGKVPDAITWRVDKLGFVTPQQDWKAQLTPTLRSYLENYNYPPELNAAYFKTLAHSDLSNNAHLSEFWRAYSVLRWMEVFGVEVGV